MSVIKKSVLIVGSLLLGSLGLVIIGADQKKESEEIERKEQFTRDPEGRVVPFGQSAEIERKRAADSRLGRPATFGEATRRLAPGRVSPFAQAVAARARTPLAQRIGELPIDAQTNIASYVESDKYDLWKTLNTPAVQLAFRDNGQNLVSISPTQWKENGYTIEVVVRNMKNGAIIQQFIIPDKFCKLSADGTTIVSYSEPGHSIYLSNTITGERRLIHIQRRFFSLLGISADGKIIALYSMGEDLQSTMTLLNTQTNELISLAINGIQHVEFSPDSRTLALSTQTGISFWNTTNGAMTYELDIPRMSIYGIGSLAFNRDGTRFAVCYVSSRGDEKKIILFDRSAHADVLTQRGTIKVNESMSILVFNSDNTKLVSVPYAIGEQLNDVWIWDLKTGRLLQKIDTWAHAVVFSSDDKILAIGNAQGIELWKKSTALQDALAKQQRIEELRTEGAASSPSSSSSSSSADQQPSTVVPPAAEVSDETSIDMEQPD